MKEDQSKISEVEHICKITLSTVENIRKLISDYINEETYVRVAGHGHSNPRAYVIYGALDEVEKATVHLLRLDELLSGTDVSPNEDHLTRNVVVSIVEEIQARSRRLIELLVVLVLFSRTNDQKHFRHMLLLEELADELRQNKDLFEFYGARSNATDSFIDVTIREIADMHENTPNLTNAWYTKSQVQTVRTGHLPNENNLLSSARERIKQALPILYAGERIVLGFSYGQGYGELSGRIHFSIFNNDWRIQTGEESRQAQRLRLLSFHILLRCYELLGSPESLNMTIIKQICRENEHSENLVRNVTIGGLQVGDFVLVHGVAFIAEIIEISETPFGYRSFFVRFLQERPISDLGEDWVLARQVRKLYSQDELMRRLSKRSEILAESIESEMRDIFHNATPEDTQEALRKALITLWNAGLRDYYHSGYYLRDSNQNHLSGDSTI